MINFLKSYLKIELSNLNNFISNKFPINYNPYLINSNLHLFQIHNNKDFLILGSGPSINDFNTEMANNKIVITINGANNIYNKSDYFLIGHAAWKLGLLENLSLNQILLLNYNFKDKRIFNKLKIYQNKKLFYSHFPGSIDNMKWYYETDYNCHWEITSNRKRILNSGPNSGPVALSLALIMGARSISFLGIDGFSKFIKKSLNMYGDPKSNLNAKEEMKDKQFYEKERMRDSAELYIYQSIKNYCDSKNIKINNLSTLSHLKKIFT